MNLGWMISKLLATQQQFESKRTDENSTNNSFNDKPTKQAICQYFGKPDHPHL